MTILRKVNKYKDFFVGFILSIIFTSIAGGLSAFFLSISKFWASVFTVIPTKLLTMIIILWFFRNTSVQDRKKEISNYINTLYKLYLVFGVILFISRFLINKDC